jgi:murein DD-endopeptidase MepM/ murein hydrolase activator NlpD
MQKPELKSLAAELRRRLPSGLSGSRLALFAITLIVFGVALGGLEPKGADQSDGFSSIAALDLPDRGGALPSQPSKPAGPGSEWPQEEWELVTVKPGESLDAIFRKLGFSAGLLHSIMGLNGDTRSLTRIRPGDVFGFQRDAAGEFRRMRYPLNEDSYLVVERAAEQLRAQTHDRLLTSSLFEARGSIDSSLFMAGKAAGLSDVMVMKLANIFGWDIDFVLDIRAGDQFYLLYEKVYRDGEYLRDGDVLAATFVNQGERFQAVRFEGGNGAQYYAPDGRHMRKAFLRAPLNFSYISSNFNPKRFHPILKRVKAHNGIDYRAPSGTPVYAAGDGRVIRSAKDQYNGNHVFLQHANNIVTKYLHFTRRSVNLGDRVKQGQVIGYVGATGLAEAPHLHYEFLVNGAHRNPRTVSLPAVEPLKDEGLLAFRAHASPYLSQLSRLESDSMYSLAP